jgi:hypothetical protein
VEADGVVGCGVGVITTRGGSEAARGVKVVVGVGVGRGGVERTEDAG